MKEIDVKKIKIGLITTLNTNIGDDFIRDGICLFLSKIYHKRLIEFVPINKHQPMTVYPRWHPCHWTERLPRGKRYARLAKKLFSQIGRSRFDDCQLIVQCGAPVFWQGCHRAEWAEPLWHQVVGRLSQIVSVLNLAAGSCYPWERQPTAIEDPKDNQFLKKIMGYCDLTTVRDVLALQLCTSLNASVPFIPCSALLAAWGLRGPMEDSGPILINYMRGGGHYDWNQGIDPRAWKDKVKSLISRLEKRHQLAFLCHNQKEYDEAGELAVNLPRLWPKNSQEYFAQVFTAKGALCNRMHAAVGLAGLGISSVTVGTDTRLLMVASLGLPIHYVKEATVDLLEEELENLMAARAQERERLKALQTETLHNYIKVVSESLTEFPI